MVTEVRVHADTFITFLRRLIRGALTRLQHSTDQPTRLFHKAHVACILEEAPARIVPA